MLKVAEGVMQALQSIDMCGPSEQLLIKDALLNGLGMMGGNSSLQKQLTLSQTNSNNATDTDSSLLTITEYLSLHFNKTIPPGQLTEIGKVVATTYRSEAGEEFADHIDIPKKILHVNGRSTRVNAYGTKQVGIGKRSGQQIVHDVLACKGLI